MKKTPLLDQQNEVLQLAKGEVGEDPLALIAYLCWLVVKLNNSASIGFIRAQAFTGDYVHKKPPDPLSK